MNDFQETNAGERALSGKMFALALPNHHESRKGEEAMKDVAQESQYETLSSDISITIDDGFKAMIPPLSAEEQTQLEQNIVEHGCRDPLVVWPLPEWTGEDGHFWKWENATIEPMIRDDKYSNGYETYRVWPSADGGENVTEYDWPFVLIDGHNRHEICTRLGIHYNVVVLSLPSREVVEDWMDANQLGRRNLAPDMFRFMLGRRYNRAKRTHGGDRKSSGQNDHLNEKTAEKLAAEHGVSEKTVRRAAEFANDVEEEIATTGEGDVLKAAAKVRQKRAEEKKQQNDEVASLKMAAPDGQYGTIVIDPPWPMQKIARDVRPNQVEFDYPVMTESELVEFGDIINASAHENCHMFMWTTQKFLPMSLRLLEAWGWKYVLTMVWHKPGGFQPIGLPQYNAEFAVYARRGAPAFRDTKAFPVCFQAPRREHSRKPDEFYDLVRRVTHDGRIEIFSREKRDGWDTWGNESEKFSEVAA